MTDRHEITRRIEELLGPTGNRVLANDMLDALEEHKHVTFSPTLGYVMQSDITERDWIGCLNQAIDYYYGDIS